eukprot:2793650-Rhodomonas_salina.1
MARNGSTLARNSYLEVGSKSLSARERSQSFITLSPSQPALRARRRCLGLLPPTFSSSSLPRAPSRSLHSA